MTMKKSLSILLSIMITIAMTMSVFAMEADETVEPQHTCTSHTYGSPITSSHYDCVNDESHALVVVKTRVCTKCGYVLQEFVSRGDPKPHDLRSVSSSCDGTTQTLVYSCDTCVTLVYKPKACPRGPHTGDCLWLPF